jgi:hypothetical protein
MCVWLIGMIGLGYTLTREPERGAVAAPAASKPAPSTPPKTVEA